MLPLGCGGATGVHRRMLEHLFATMQLALFFATLAVSTLIFLFRQFPIGRAASFEVWRGKIGVAWVALRHEGLGQALHRAILLAIGGAFLVMAASQRVDQALSMALIYYVIGAPVFMVLKVLQLAELPREELDGLAAVARSAQERRNQGRRGR